MPTTRNARGIDIVAYNADGTKFLGLQVKSLSNRVSVPLGNNLDKVAGDFWIIVCNLSTGSPETFILTPTEVKARAARAGTGSFWLQAIRRDNPFKAYVQPEFREAWDRIGSPTAATFATARERQCPRMNPGKNRTQSSHIWRCGSGRRRSQLVSVLGRPVRLWRQG